MFNKISSKISILVLILVLSIGFAAVATNLIINGSAKISSNPDDFDVYFIDAVTYYTGNATISSDKKSITWTSSTLTTVGEIVYLDYTVYNSSSNYDANVLIRLNIEDSINHNDYSEYYTIRTTTFNNSSYTLIHGKEALKGSIEVELIKPVLDNVSLDFTMTFDSEAVARDSSIGPALAPCNIVSGTGHDIGDEITCGGENFYLLDNQDGMISMLSKYNLLDGKVYNKTTFTHERFTEILNTYGHYNQYGGRYSFSDSVLEIPELAEMKSYHEEFEGEIYYENYGVDDDFIEVTKNIRRGGLAPKEFLPHQDSRALGAHGGELGQPAYPEVGVLFNTYAKVEDEIGYDVYYANDDIFYAEILDDYNDYLKEYYVYAKEVSILGLDDIKDLVYRMSNRMIPLRQWFENQNLYARLGNPSEHYVNSIFILGDLKEYVPVQYSWLYSTTYWTKTAATQEGLDYIYDRDGVNIYRHVFFVDTLGYVCSKYGCDKALGAGIRPVIRMSDSFLNYNTGS